MPGSTPRTPLAPHDGRQLGRRRHGVQAAVARAVVRLEDGELAVEPEDRGRHHGDVEPHRRVVEQVARREVVDAVDDHVVAVDDLHDVGGVQADGVLDDLDVRVERGDRRLGRVDLRRADRLRRVDDLALQVGEVDLVVVDDAERADARGGEVERGRGAEPAGAEQQHLGVEQLGLALGADLGEQDVAAVALLLLGGQHLGDLDLVAAVLPQRDPARHRAHVGEAEQLGQRVRGERGALTGGAVEDDRLVAVGHRGVDPGLEVPARHVDRARDVAAVPLLGLAHVDQRDPVPEVLGDLGGVDLADLLLDLPDDLGSGRAHVNSS